MKLFRTILSWLMPLVILGLGVAAFVLLGSQPPPERRPAEPPRPAIVRTIEVAAEPSGLSIETDGVVVPLREVTVAAEVPGRVLRRAADCREGRFVKAGTLLFEIDPRDYELEVARLERELRQSELAIDELDEEILHNRESVELARRQVDLARREVKRLDGLRSSRIVTETDHERALRDELVASSSFTALEGQGRVLAKRRHRFVEARGLAETMLERARLDLSRTRVAAPADGIIVRADAEQDSFVAKGTPLVTIEDTTSAEVRTSLQMDEVARVWGSRSLDVDRGVHGSFDVPATVVFSIRDSSYEWSGSLSRQEGRGLDERTRTLPCRVLVPDPEDVRALDRYGAVLPALPPGAPRSLLRGMFVQVRVHVESAHEIVSIPDEARRPGGDLWLLRDGRLEIVKARPVQVARGRAYFESGPDGLLPGDRVVTSQLAGVRPGMPLVAEETPLTEAAALPAGTAASGTR
jgi:multidrug efflux pump subunit AcrA (membrane-fusion protein)